MTSPETFAWDAIYETEYTQLARSRIRHLADRERGWMAGVYEKTGAMNKALSLNTNAVILEAIHYKRFGPLWQVAHAPDSITSAPIKSPRPAIRPETLEPQSAEEWSWYKYELNEI